MVKISIIMPIYNANELLLEQSIESIEKQTFKDIELVCINDGSTDDTLGLLTKLSDKFDFMKIYTQNNQGSGIARNNGIKYANGEYIAFLDADDIFVDDDALEKLYNEGTKNNADIVSGNMKRIDLDGNVMENYNYKVGNYTYFSDYVIISPEDYGIPWAFYKNIFRRKFLTENEIYFPDLKRGQDPPFLAKSFIMTDKITGVPVDLYGYNYSVGGGAGNKINTYGKKFDYIYHFKLTFDILEKKGYYDLINRYKKRLFAHLNSNFENDNALEGFNIINNIFGDDNSYFKGFEDNINAFKIKQIINHLDVTDDEEFFHKGKDLISNYDIWSNDILPLGLLKKCSLILSVDSLEDYKNHDAEISGSNKVSLTVFNAKNIDNNENKNLDKFLKYITARIDLKNLGDASNNIEIIENSDDASKISYPKWFSDKKGIGTQIQSKQGNIHLKIKCINKGELKIFLRGVFYKNRETNKTMPIYIKYDKLAINNENIIKKPVISCHDNPFIFKQNVKNNEIIDIAIQWSVI